MYFGGAQHQTVLIPVLMSMDDTSLTFSSYIHENFMSIQNAA